MSDISSLSEPYDDQELSDASSQFALDVEDPNEVADEERRLGQAAGGNDEREFVGPYMGEPLADEEWLQNYNRERREEGERLERLGRRLDGTEPLNEWCRCGNCSIALLQNAKECKCCQEVEGCLDAMNEFRVLEELGEPPACVIDHPGFKAICLNPWTLELLADQYKTIQKARYRNLGSEKRFMRAVAYRAFTRLIHGKLGNKRVPLPACAYHAIRQKFNLLYEQATGYAERDEDE